MKLTGFIGSLNVVEEPAEPGGYGRIPLLPADRGAHVRGGRVGADFIVLPLLNRNKYIFISRSILVSIKCLSVIEAQFYYKM